MQKTTLFVLVLTVLVSLTLADFLVDEPLSASTIPVASPEIQTKIPDNPVDTEVTPDETPAPSSGEVSQFLQTRQFKLDSVTAGALEAVGFKGMKLEKATFDAMIFQLLDVSTYPNLSAVRYHLTDGKNVFGILHEFEFGTEAESVAFYADLKQKIGAFSPRVSAHETNQYGNQSFFMNDSTRSGTAFLVFRLQKHDFAFSYPKASHEFFKTFILSLAK